MHTYLIRVELLHQEYQKDYNELALMLRACNMYTVIYNRLEEQWLGLPSGQFIFSDTTMELKTCHLLIKKMVEKIIRNYNKYKEEDIKTYYMILVNEVAKTTDGKPLLIGNLHKAIEKLS